MTLVNAWRTQHRGVEGNGTENPETTSRTRHSIERDRQTGPFEGMIVGSVPAPLADKASKPIQENRGEVVVRAVDPVLVYLDCKAK